ncbi:MAG TPA: hypothetical protein VJ875_16965 [Pyrinomonadaceae bacterium]|nr:hypothetical protein [Pyrinomonadaceae bacterium]
MHRAQRNTGNSIHFQTKEKESLSSVYGRVVYYGSEQPARRIRVVMRSLTSYGPEQLTGITNARGEFRIAGVPAGRYFIGVNGRGVVSTDSFIELDEARENRFDVTELRKYFEEVEVDGRTDKQVVIRAHRGGVITGKVSYANGDAAVDHPITILRRKGNRYSMFWINLTSMAYMLVTDDRGVFRVTGLPTGEYVVGATPMIEHGELIKDSTLEVNMVGSSLAMTFYPSTSLITKATPISIEAGEEKTGVDITIADQQFHTVAGTVRARDDHKPIASARITIIRKESYEKVGRAFWPYSMGMPGVNTDEQGRWRFGEVPDGRYIIFVEPPTEYDQPSTTTKRYGSKQQEIEVSGGNINNLLIEVGDDATIAGTVVVESGPMPAGIYLWLTTEGISSGVSANATVQPGGRFVIRNVPAAKMYFAVNLEQDIERFYLKSITWNGKDLLREPLDITADTKIDGVKIVLSREVASFTIRVRNNRGEPVPDVSLTLVSSDRARWVRREEQLFGNTNAQGNCTIIGAPGEYLVFVLPRGVQGSTLEKDEIEQGAAQAPRVSLRPGERRTFDVVLPPDR